MLGYPLLARRFRYCGASKCPELDEERKCPTLTRNDVIDPSRQADVGGVLTPSPATVEKAASATACASDAALADIWVNRSWRQIVGAETIACSSCTGQGAFRQRVFASVEGLPGRQTALWRSKEPVRVRENALGVVQRSLGQALGRRSSPAHRCHGDSVIQHADLLRQARARMR